MITCVVVDAQLDRYLTGALPSSESDALELHASTCERCGPMLEERGRLDVLLARELPLEPAARDLVMTRIASQPRTTGRRHWWVPVAMAASVLLAVSVTRPGVKSGQRPQVAGSPAAIAAERADGEFRHLDAAQAELRDAIAKAPHDAMLQRALERLDAQRKSLENLIREFES